VARSEHEHVGRKPLGDGFVAFPVRGFRGAIVRPFQSKGIDFWAWTCSSRAGTAGKPWKHWRWPTKENPSNASRVSRSGRTWPPLLRR